MSLKLVPFESLNPVSYSPSIVTIAVCEIFENRVRVRSKSLEMTTFDRAHRSSYSSNCRCLESFARYSELLVENREIFIYPTCI